MKAKLSELNQKWESLKSKASQRRQDLEDSLQAQQYFADANEAESWMREKEPIVGSTDYGKDEDSAEVSERGDPAGVPVCGRCGLCVVGFSGCFRTWCLLCVVETHLCQERGDYLSLLSVPSVFAILVLFPPHTCVHERMFLPGIGVLE